MSVAQLCLGDFLKREACARLDVQLVLSLGGGGKPEKIGELAGEPIVVEFAPQLELLKRAALCITHAGLNTALECLSNGLPMVAIPITNDQPWVAARSPARVISVIAEQCAQAASLEDTVGQKAENARLMQPSRDDAPSNRIVRSPA